MDYIAESLRPLATRIVDLHQDPANARKGHAIDRIAASLKAYGQRKPIVVNRAQGGKVEAGNGTLAAAKQLGWTHIAAVFVDDDPATAAAFGIADNRVAEFSEWDAEILADLMPTLEGLETGFQIDELDAFVAPADDEWGGAFAKVPDSDRQPFQNMTFTLHDDQVTGVKEALRLAGQLPDIDDSPNQNSNGNALWRVCRAYVEANHG